MMRDSVCVKCGLVHLAVQCDALWVKRASTFVLATLVAGCGTSSAAPAPSPQLPAQVAPAASIAIDEELPEEEAPLPTSDRALDQMDRSELEAACMGGSSAACDRLGH